MSELPTELRLSLDWELWVVEQLLFTGKRDELVEVLVGQGIEREIARERLGEILASPGFARLRARVGEADLAARLQRLWSELAPLSEVPVAEELDPDALLRDHWIASRPIRLTRAARGIRAVREWSLEGLGARFGGVPVEVNVGRTAAASAPDTEKLHRTIRFADVVARARSEETNDWYVVSRNGLLSREAFRPLWDDLDPLPAYLVPQPWPRGASLWLGPAGTVTPPHFDPHNVLLVQIEGAKQVRLARRLRAPLHAWLDGYYLRAPLDEVFAPTEILTVRLEAGEALFVPVGWFHEVTSLAPSLTLSLMSFRWPNRFHWLGPPGSDDV